MKGASSATLAILATGKWLLAELYDITLATGQVYHFTSFQVPVTASVYSPAAGPFTYQTGLTIKRGTISQKAGTEAGTMKLTVSPQFDSPNAPILINGYPLLQACQYGMLDSATIQMNKLFMNVPTVGGQFDTSPQAVGWFLGQVQDVQIDRVSAQISVYDYLALLGNQQMPRQLFMPGCWHQVYDAGCTLLKSAFTVSGAVTGVMDSGHFNTNLTAADDYFDQGVITMSSGVNNTFTARVSSYKNASGYIALTFPFPKPCSVGDTFTIYPGCDLQQSTCTNKFNNLAHFGGTPYTPVPETILDGDVNSMPQQSIGSQAGQLIGSLPSGRVVNPGGYKY